MENLKWWDTLETRLENAIENDWQGRALDCVLTAWEAAEHGKITMEKARAISDRYDEWEKSWAD